MKFQEGTFNHSQLLNLGNDDHTQYRYLSQLATSGIYICGSIGRGASSTQGITANTLFAHPIFIRQSTAFDRIAINVTTAGVLGSLARVGIYNSNASNYPSTLVLDAGTVAVDSTGTKTIIINQTLAIGVYWLVIVSDGAPVITGHTGAGASSFLGISDPATAVNNLSYQVAFTFAALPATFTAGATLSAVAYIVFIRVT